MARKIRKSIRGKGKTINRRRNRTIRRRKIRGGVGEQITGYFYPTASNEYNDEIYVDDKYELTAATSQIEHLGQFVVNGYGMFSRFPKGNYLITSVERDTSSNYTRYKFNATKQD